MNKTEYMNTINNSLATAEGLCADLRKLRILQKLAKEISGAAELVASDKVEAAITAKESELKRARAELQKARRVVKKLEEIEAIEAGTEKKKPAKATATKAPAAKKELAAKKPAPKKAEQPSDTAA